MITCNNCNFIGNEEDLLKLFEADGTGCTASEITQKGLEDKVDDMCDGCPECKTDSFLSDVDTFTINGRYTLEDGRVIDIIDTLFQTEEKFENNEVINVLNKLHSGNEKVTYADVQIIALEEVIAFDGEVYAKVQK